MTFTTEFSVTSIMITGACITVLLAIIAIVCRAKLTTGVPGGLQNCVEWAVGSLRNFFGGIMGADKANKYLPFLGTMFIFILISNYSGLLPMSGKIFGLHAPTSSISCTIALALLVFFTTHGAGFKVNKLHYFGHFVKPVVIMLPFLIIEEIVRPVSLSLRLYGNIFGEETVTEQLFELVPVFVPVIMQALGLLFGFIQAMVFTLLAAIYIDGATGEGH